MPTLNNDGSITLAGAWQSVGYRQDQAKPPLPPVPANNELQFVITVPKDQTVALNCPAFAGSSLVFLLKAREVEDKP